LKIKDVAQFYQTFTSKKEEQGACALHLKLFFDLILLLFATPIAL